MSIRLQTDRMCLIASERGLAARMLQFHQENKEHFEPWEDTLPDDFYTLAYHYQIVRAEKTGFKKGTGVNFWMEHRDSGAIIGKISVFGLIGGNFSTCWIGYKVARDYEGQGYMSEALREVVRFLFENVNLHRIEINILPRNARSRNLAESCGFIAEGIAKQLMRINGVWEDHIRYARVNEKYLEG